MDTAETFHIFEHIMDTDSFMVKRARREGDQNTVLLRKLRIGKPSNSEKARFFKEYQTLQALNSQAILKIHDIIEERDEITLVTEDCPGSPLSHILKKRRFDTDEFLTYAIQLADALEYLHGKGVYHGNINADSIFVDELNQAVKLVDFGIDALITGARSTLYNERFIRDILPYLSPEQTGRVNRSEDYRSDFYSLGITFFQMITGIVPFRSQDPLELIHCHIARPPVSPEMFVPQLPRTLSEILYKLMAKAPEERYQSAFGLKADLIECSQRLARDGRIAPFGIASHDIPQRFIIPQKLYGREDEIRTLLNTFEQVCRGKCQVMLVNGVSGIGKSALVYEIHKPIVAKRGYFIMGKYEQYKSDSPYNAIIQAFKGLIRQILAENEASIQAWSTQFKEALGPNSGVITEIFPELTLITGDHIPPAAIGPEEARNRFNTCFEAFVSVFVSAKRPLAVFLDDLQWADFSSLNLLYNLLLSLEIKHIFFILSYRSNEVSEDHPFIEMIHEVKNQGVNPGMITLAPLSGKHIGRLISDFLKCPDEKGRTLGDQIFTKTAGNPFFINQFLKTLYDNGKITFDPGKGWTWDETDIATMQVTDNVVHLMADKIAKLPESTLEILKISACIGNRFDIETLSDVLKKSMDEILSDLKTAIDEGYVRHVGDMLLFHHDRIQEAAYSLIPDADKAGYHLRIGERALENSTDPADRLNKLFYITDQLNLSMPVIHEPEKQKQLFQLNVDAGKKAKGSAAFDPALKYLKQAETLLDKGNLGIQLPEYLDLFCEIADAACLIGDYTGMDAYVAKVLSFSPSMPIRVKICGIEIRAYFARQNYKMSLLKSRELLARLGVKIPKKVSLIHILFEILKVKLRLKSMGENAVRNLSAMDDEHQLAISKIYFEMGVAASLTDIDMYGFIVLKRFRQVLTHGLNPYASLFFLGYGALSASALDDVENAIYYGDLAMELAERAESQAFKYKTHTIFGTLIRHWKEPLELCRTASIQAYGLSREAGDQIFTGMALTYRDFISFLTSNNLNELRDQIANRVKITWKSGQRPMIQFHTMVLQLMHHLTNPSPNPTVLSGQYFNENDILPEWIETSNTIGLAHYYTIHIALHYFALDYDAAQKALQEAKAYKKAVKSMVAFQLLTYFECLNLLALYPSVSKAGKRQTLTTVKRLLKKITAWATYEPTKQRPWIYLIEAELSAAVGDHGRAPVFYDKASEAFTQTPSPLFQAAALLRAGLYYHQNGLKRSARAYLADAIMTFKEMGVVLFESFYRKHWANSILSGSGAKPFQLLSQRSYSSSGENLDFSSIMKSSQALSGEIVLDKLVKTIMTLSLESAGAQRGFLLLSRNDEMVIKAYGSVDHNDITLLNDSPENHKDELSLAIINYVTRTHEAVVLCQACMEGGFVSDAYIRNQGIKSLLAAPMVSSGEFKGIIYLENNLAPKVFSQERIHILDILASQAAISLENARLFKDVIDAENKLRQFNVELEQKVEERTSELKSAYEQIKVMAHTDPLTGLSNRRIMLDKIREEVIRYKRSQLPFSLVIGDIDHFKTINDTYGHDCGDNVLVTLSNIMVDRLREEDTVARWGGEEFLFLLPMTGSAGAVIAMEKVRNAICSNPIHFNGKDLSMSMTFGISTYDGKTREYDVYLKQADEALYKGKQSGRNRVVLFDY